MQIKLKYILQLENYLISISIILLKCYLLLTDRLQPFDVQIQSLQKLYPKLVRLEQITEKQEKSSKSFQYVSRFS